MANILELGLLEGFTKVFTFLLIFLVLFGAMELRKLFGEGKTGLHAVMALAIAFMFLVFPKGLELIQTMTPWFVILFIIAFMVIMIFRFLGASESGLMSTVERPGVYWTILIIIIIIFIASIGSVFFTGEEGAPTTTGGGAVPINASAGDVGGYGEAAAWATIFHPKMLGMIFFMLIAVFTITLLSSNMKPS
ncbi:hypothetical protein JXB02_02660 [Candidatus Woesearchaeota archaeon]|nr:hypothetical protein [Candidatus Woesearchaeota archaeon]